VAMRIIGEINEWHRAADCWQTCVLQPRCIVVGPDQRRLLVIACQDNAARVWPVCCKGDIMMLDTGTPLEWAVATDIDGWAVLPWQPNITIASAELDAGFGCVTFRQIRHPVSALAWAVAHHHLEECQLLRFTHCRAAGGSKDLLESLLKDHPDKVFYMDLFNLGKTEMAIPSSAIDLTKASLAELDPANRSCLMHESPWLMGLQSGISSSQSSGNDEAAQQPRGGPMAETVVESVLIRGNACMELPACAQEAPVRQCGDSAGACIGTGVADTVPKGSDLVSRRKPARGEPAYSNLAWVQVWLPPFPFSGAKRFGIYRIEATNTWSAFYSLNKGPLQFKYSVRHT